MTDPIRDYVQMEFRDGDREIPDYLADMMQGIKTHTMTYEQAIAAANKKVESDLLNAKQDQVLAAHFKGLR